MTPLEWFEVPQGRFRLRRLHPEPNLRAWDAADEFALHHVHDQGLDRPGQRWLVANDDHGALAVALAAAGGAVTSWHDSCVAQRAVEANAAAALHVGPTDPGSPGTDVDAGAIEFVPSTAVPTGPVDGAVVVVPRTLAYLEEQLADLADLLPDGATVIGAGMTRHVHTSTVEAFERLVGPTTTTRARKKARLLLARVDHDRVRPTATRWRTWTTREVEVHARSNVFSSTGLDAGAHCLLDHVDGELHGASRGLDLGSGSGVVGATIARRSGIALDATDASFHAVDSSTRTLAANGSVGTAVASDAGDVLSPGYDVVVCNPPFHAGGARTDAVAGRMFARAHELLVPGGRLLVVGNRHLRHDRALARRFDDVTVIGSDPRFVVVRATRS